MWKKLCSGWRSIEKDTKHFSSIKDIEICVNTSKICPVLLYQTFYSSMNIIAFSWRFDRLYCFYLYNQQISILHSSHIDAKIKILYLSHTLVASKKYSSGTLEYKKSYKGQIKYEVECIKDKKILKVLPNTVMVIYF